MTGLDFVNLGDVGVVRKRGCVLGRMGQPCNIVGSNARGETRNLHGVGCEMTKNFLKIGRKQNAIRVSYTQNEDAQGHSITLGGRCRNLMFSTLHSGEMSATMHYGHKANAYT